MSELIFFKLCRKKGFSETIEILSEFKNNEAIQSVFFEQLKKKKSYLNSFFRAKEDLLSSGIIAYKLSPNNEKIIYLTEKGKELNNLLNKIEVEFD